MLKRSLISGLCAAAVCLAGHSAQAQSSGTVVKMIPQFDLRIIDPIWTTAYTTRNHAYMVYDTLFGIDEKGVIRPQMVDTYSASADKKTWTFTLRPGLKFHDGAPVTSDDVIASLARWGKRDSLGQQMYAFLDKAEAVDAKTFRLSFTRPFSMVPDALGKPSGLAPFIMPKRVAMTPADKQIEDATGSGPYIFKKDEFRAGERAVYVKNPDYVSRSEPPSGTAGGKPVYVDRFEWLVIKDPQTQINALIKGEVDMIEWIPTEHYSTLKSNPSVELVEPIPPGGFALHMNHLQPPFDNPKISRAAIMAINQQALMRAQITHKDLYSPCTSIYSCNTPFAKSASTGYFTGMPKFEEAKKLLKEAGYDGRPIVFMYPPEFTVLNKFGPVMAQLLTQAGFKVDLQSLDWPSILMRRTSKEPVGKGGWNMFITGWGAPDRMNPMFMPPLTGNGEKGWFGWPTDEKLESLKTDFLFAPDESARRKIAEQIQLRVYESGLFAPVGETRSMMALRKGKVSGVIPATVNVFWNIRKH